MIRGATKLSLKEMFYYVYNNTLIPELFELLGEDLAVEFIQVFSGAKVAVPNYRKVMNLQRNLEIYETLSSAPGDFAVQELAKKYGVTEVWIREINRNMKIEHLKIQKFLEKLRSREKLRVTTKRDTYGASKKAAELK